MGLLKHGTELPESIQVGQCLDDLTNFQGRFVPFSDYNLSFSQFNPLYIQVILFIASAFANHVLVFVTRSTKTPIQDFNRLVGMITPSLPAILAACFPHDTGTPTMSAHAFLWKTKLRAAFLAIQDFNRLVGMITPSRPAILAAYFPHDTGTPIMSANAFLWKTKLRVAFLAIKILCVLRPGIALLV